MDMKWPQNVGGYPFIKLQQNTIVHMLVLIVYSSLVSYSYMQTLRMNISFILVWFRGFRSFSAGSFVYRNALHTFLLLHQRRLL
jgi:hypothetical protein